ncbi:MAG TPA: class I SAM-dependent methyltransferase [Polyangiales bacterium]|nr:class I SAM-dependent methyltransferase [Polyangiales bacterium]
MVTEALAAAFAARRALGLPDEQTTAYRLVHAEGEGALTVDVYGEFAVASFYDEIDPAWLDALAPHFAGVYLKHRPKQANDVGEQERAERAPAQAVRGRDASSPLLVLENGVPFEVRLGEGFSTGIFLDQRDNRARVMELAVGKSVLNLFAYTCGFGVAAAFAGASRTVNIDVAKNVLERGRLNYALSHLEGEFLARDVFETLPKLHRRGERFDLVVLDPPSYASTKRGRFSVERDYPALAQIALDLLADQGTLLACLNHHKLTERDLETALRSAASRAGRTIRGLDFAPVPADHTPARGRQPHLKSAWIRS